MHVMGFFHEHSRADRDDYVKIIWDNIAKSDKDQFAKHEDGNTYGLPYDYESVMHYKHNAFAKDSSIPTILPTTRKAKIGQNKDLSPLDVVRIHRRFRCAIADPKTFAGSDNKNEKPNNCPVTEPMNNDQCECECSLEDGENKETVLASDTFPQYSHEPMTVEQCGHQFTTNCNIPKFTPDNCTVTQGLTINCSTFASSAEIRQISAGISTAPLRAVGIALYDGDQIIFKNFETVRHLVAYFQIKNCISSRTVQKLAVLRFSSLLEFEMKDCYGLEIMKTDFSQTTKLKVITFTNTTIQILDKGTFTDLPYLRLLTLELGMQTMDVFRRAIRNFLKRLHCGCEFQWFREWWDTNRQLLRKAGSGEVYFIPDSFRSSAFRKEDIYLPIDCSVNPFPSAPSFIDHKQYRFSINVPDFSGIDIGKSHCSDKLGTSKDAFVAFSTDPMTAEECDAQFTDNCAPLYTKSECMETQSVRISCNEEANSEEIKGMLSAIKKAPLRAVAFVSYDNSELSSTDLGEVGKQIIIYSLFNCTGPRTTGKLRKLSMPNLLSYNLNTCFDLHVKREDFDSSQKLRMIAFGNSTIRTIESDTFSQLPALRILSLELGIRKVKTFSADTKDYLFRLHCSCEFFQFRIWRRSNKQLLRMAERGKIFWFQASYRSSEFQPGDVYVPVDCSAKPFPPGPRSINFAQIEYSLNEPSC